MACERETTQLVNEGIWLNLTVTASFDTISLAVAAVKCAAVTFYLLVAVITPVLLTLLAWPMTTTVVLMSSCMLILFFVEAS
jgi:hypothetical protein